MSGLLLVIRERGWDVHAMVINALEYDRMRASTEIVLVVVEEL